MKLISMMFMILPLISCSSEQIDAPSSSSFLVDEGPSDPDPEFITPYKNFKMGSFKARYYENEEFKSEETVPMVALNSSDSGLGISSADFVGKWQGILETFEDDQLIDFKFHLSWAKLKIYVDDEVIVDAENSHRITSHLFRKSGKYLIRVEYENNWHTYDINLTLSQNPTYTLTQAEKIIRPLITEDTEIIYVGAYESTHRSNVIYISLEKRTRPVFLVATSYSSVNWKIIIPKDVEVKAIVYTSSEISGEIFITKSVPTFEIPEFGKGYKEDQLPRIQANIKRFTDRPAEKSFMKYGLHSVRVFP